MHHGRMATSAARPTRPLGRAVTVVERHGLRGAARRTRDWVLTPLWRRVHLDEEHLWITIPDFPEPQAIPDGYAVRAGTEDDLEALAAIGGIAPATARRYLQRGARLYVATYGDELAFSTWIHVGAVPTEAAQGGELALPDGVLSFEDSLAAPRHRRSGIALAAVEVISRREHAAGAKALITRVALDNAPALRWAEKMGAMPVATVRLRRLLGSQRVRVTPVPGGEAVAQLLAERL
jgi:GNAT superfamily N-acetyltransferase